MPILIDPPVWPFRGRLFSHLASDSSIDELHEFAVRVGLHPRSYDGDHYDVPDTRYAEVVAAGAREVTNRELLAAVSAAGLRFRKRRGERPLASLPDALPFLGPDPHRFELLASPWLPPETTTFAAVAFVTDVRGHILLVHSPSRSGWEAPGGWRERAETAADTAVRELREETGVVLDADAMTPVGYERIRFQVPPADPRLHPTCHVAVLAGRVDAPGADGVGPEGRPVVWADTAEARRRCDAAPWWPLLESVLDG